MCLSFQEKPSLLIPWMVYTLVFVVENTAVNIFYAVQFIAMGDGPFSAGVITGAIIHLRE
jgi:hypothetical protein